MYPKIFGVQVGLSKRCLMGNGAKLFYYVNPGDRRPSAAKSLTAFRFPPVTVKTFDPAQKR
jgi:hypothetical protein